MSAVQAGMETAGQVVPSGPGARLKSARERAGLSLDQVAQALKLAPRQVRALEEEDFAQLPGRTFARGFVRNYARLLNLDGDDLLAQLPDAAHAPALAAPSLNSTGATMGEVPTGQASRTSLGRWLIPLVLVACIVGAGAYEWYRSSSTSPGEPPRAEQPSVASTAPAFGTARSELPNPLAPAPVAQPAPLGTEQGTASGTGAPSTGAEGPAADAGAPTAEAAAPAAEAPAAATAASSDTPAPAAAAETPALVLTYRGPSWTEVRDRQGQVLLLRLVPAGTEQAIRGSAPFDVVIGNARAVTLAYRGQPIDLARYTRQNVARLRLP